MAINHRPGMGSSHARADQYQPAHEWKRTWSLSRRRSRSGSVTAFDNRHDVVDAHRLFLTGFETAEHPHPIPGILRDLRDRSIVELEPNSWLERRHVNHV